MEQMEQVHLQLSRQNKVEYEKDEEKKQGENKKREMKLKSKGEQRTQFMC